MSVQALRIRLPGLAVVVYIERLRRQTGREGQRSEQQQEDGRRALTRCPATIWEATSSIAQWR